MNPLVEWLRRRGHVTAVEVCEGLGVSPATLSRLFGRADGTDHHHGGFPPSADDTAPAG